MIRAVRAKLSSRHAAEPAVFGAGGIKEFLAKNS